jgi:predicted dehydrogenase
MKKFRVGIIGHSGRGNYGHQLDQAFLDNENAEIVAIADVNSKVGKAKADEYKCKFYNYYKEMLDNENLDIVVVAPRYTDVHYEYVKESLIRNCHVLCEKPFVQSLDQADELIGLAEERKLCIAVSLPFSYETRFDQVIQIIQDGVIGEVRKLEGVCKHDHRGGGEDFAILGPHFSDMMIRICGAPKKGYGFVSYKGNSINETDIIEGNEGLGLIAGDNIFAVYQFENGVIGTLESKKLDIMERSKQPYYLKIYGSKGILKIRAPYGDHSIWYYPEPFEDLNSNTKWIKLKTTEVRTYGDYQKLIAEDLISSIQNGHNPKSSAQSFRHVLEMLLTPYYSLYKDSIITYPIEDRTHPLKKYKEVLINGK